MKNLPCWILLQIGAQHYSPSASIFTHLANYHKLYYVEESLSLYEGQGSHVSFISLHIGSMNALLRVWVDSTNIVNAFVHCTFEPGYTCTINYGTDSSFTNLVYSDTSSTQERITTIILSQELQKDTTYYFIVSAEGSPQCARVHGTFRTGGCIKSGVYLTQR